LTGDGGIGFAAATSRRGIENNSEAELCESLIEKGVKDERHLSKNRTLQEYKRIKKSFLAENPNDRS